MEASRAYNEKLRAEARAKKIAQLVDEAKAVNVLKAELASLKAGRKTYEKQCGLYFLTDRQAIDVAGKAAVVEQQKRQLGSKEQKS